MARGKNFFQRQLRRRPAKGRDFLHDPRDFLPTLIGLGNKARNRLAVPGDDQCLTALDLIQQAGKVRFCFGSLNFPHEDFYRLNQLVYI